MASNDYVFITHWRVPRTVAAVYEVLINGVDFVRWWPQVYLEVEETVAGKLAVGRRRPNASQPPSGSRAAAGDGTGPMPKPS